MNEFDCLGAVELLCELTHQQDPSLRLNGVWGLMNLSFNSEQRIKSHIKYHDNIGTDQVDNIMTTLRMGAYQVCNITTTFGTVQVYIIMTTLGTDQVYIIMTTLGTDQVCIIMTTLGTDQVYNIMTTLGTDQVYNKY